MMKEEGNYSSTESMAQDGKTEHTVVGFSEFKSGDEAEPGETRRNRETGV